MIEGERNFQARLTEEKVIKIRELHWKGYSQQTIADMFKVNQSTISSIIRGKTWKHV